MVDDVQALETVKLDLFNSRDSLTMIHSMFCSDMDIRLASGPISLVIKQLTEDIEILERVLRTNYLKEQELENG